MSVRLDLDAAAHDMALYSAAMATIFICHASRDKRRFVARLANDLTAVGHDVWYDDWSINPGEKLALKIDQGIGECDVFLLIMSSAALKSEWVKFELNSALMKEINRRNVFVIPLLIGAVTLDSLPESIRSKKCLDFRHLTNAKYGKLFADLSSAINTNATLRVRPTKPILIPRVRKAHLQNSDIELVTLGLFRLLCFLNELEMDWHYRATDNVAELFLTHAGERSPAIPVRLDEYDRSRMAHKPVTPMGFEILQNKDDDSHSVHLLRLFYQVGRRKVVSAYWLNQPIMRQFESRAYEFAGDWDTDATLSEFADGS